MIVLRFIKYFEVEFSPKGPPCTVQAGPHGTHRNLHGQRDALIRQVGPGIQQQRFAIDGSHALESAGDAPGRHSGVHLGGDPVRIIGHGFAGSRFGRRFQYLGLGPVVPSEQVGGYAKEPGPGILPVKVKGVELLPGDQKGFGRDVVGREVTGLSRRIYEMIDACLSYNSPKTSGLFRARLMMSLSMLTLCIAR